MSYEAKTNWQLNDTVLPADMNRIEQGVEDLDNRYLETDTSLYVATTGSDVTGNGSESNPYATIGKAISVIPKNLGDNEVIVHVADGIYNEDVVIGGFSNGVIRVYSSNITSISSVCTVNSFLVSQTHAYIFISGFNIITNTKHGIESYNTHEIIVRYCKATGNNSGFAGFRFAESSFQVWNCIAINENVALLAYKSYGTSNNWGVCSGNGIGIQSDSGSIITTTGTQPQASNQYYQSRGGAFISSFGAKIGTLSSNTTLYVATTGSDTTGDGTAGNPFKTIQHAVDIIPKDLNGYSVVINVANGTYPEDVRIFGFNNGDFRLYSSDPSLLSDNCKVNSINMRYNTCVIVVGGFSVMTTTSDGIVAESCTSLNVQYMKIVGNALSSMVNGISIYHCYAFSVWVCQVSYHNVALSAYNSQGVSNSWAACIGNNYGLYSSYGSTVTIVGAQPAANYPYAHDSGGSFVYDNGTQISDLITSGLSCTWGNIEAGGYYRNGNLNGVAQIIVNLRISITTPLTAGQQYQIGGFPTYGGQPIVAVTTHNSSSTGYCYLNNLGFLVFSPTVNITTGQIIFSCTYITNS